MIIDFFITIWNIITSVVSFILTMPLKLVKLVKKLLCPTKKLRTFK